MNMVLTVLGIALLVPACFACAYFVVLAGVGLARAGKSLIGPCESPKHKFAIVIPAHNEQETIAEVLASCRGLDYPPNMVTVFVIADNCSDRTADIVRNQGCTCLERQDAEKKGKGFALEWAFQKLLPEGYDCYIIMDADCHIEPHALRVFDTAMSAGAKVLQANYVSCNSDDSVISYTVAVGNVIENRLFYAPKSFLGLAVFLRGTGVVIHREVLFRHPWTASSAVEDTEYTLRLIRDGIRIVFLPGVLVKTLSPNHWQQLRVQRTRWADNLRIGRLQGLRLIGEGLARGSLSIMDAGWTLLILSRPVVFFELFLALLVAGLCVWLEPSALSASLLIVGLIVALLQVAYLGLGVLLLGLNRHRFNLLLRAPLVVLNLIRVALAAMFWNKSAAWERTPRREE